jgi:hypothetical protein
MVYATQIYVFFEATFTSLRGPNEHNIEHIMIYELLDRTKIASLLNSQPVYALEFVVNQNWGASLVGELNNKAPLTVVYYGGLESI